ncbi:MAG: sulfatase-like hydrolase/transferase [Phycisphaerae bacterium]|nr:sulfatase-like hydrolase/transferase [Phycisphaerae bacterium]
MNKQHLMKRRTFLKLSGLGVLTASQSLWAQASRAAQKPNILLIMTDQQFADAMSCVMGRQYIHTPNMDALAERGMRFTRAYSPNPLCMPMRASLMTGQYPHKTGIQSNSGKIDPAKHHFMGKVFKEAGYETAYFGKWHVAVNKNRKDIHGFDVTDFTAQQNPEPAADFLKTSHLRPFFAMVSFLGPHEICQWARKEAVPGGGIGDPPPLNERPPLRPNFEAPEHETDIMTHMRKSYQASRLFPVGDYTVDDWRRQIWGYYRLIERVDGLIGTVLKALDESEERDNTLVVFFSDHGDCHGAHRWNQKTVFYDESSRVPFILSWPGQIAKGTSDVLLNTGIDMMPTLCDFAGVDVPAELPGKSLKAPAMGRAPAWQRDYIVSQNHMVQCEPVDGRLLTPHGRMVRSDRYKYCVYSEGQRRESLVDMKNDPGEMKNLAQDAAHRKALEQHRQYLIDWCRQYGDEFSVPSISD